MGSFDLQNFAINRHQSLMHGYAYRGSPLCVVTIHTKLESILPAYAGDRLILSCGFGKRLRKLGVDRRSADLSPIVQ
jgi:hypothetical protein